MRLMWDVDVGLTQEGEAGGVSGAQLVGRISSLELRRGPGVGCGARRRVLACLSKGVASGLGPQGFPASSAARGENGSLKGSKICGRVKLVVGILMG
eukprot:scaffold2376_cov115-Isochrysis_galbana.AAC.16